MTLPFISLPQVPLALLQYCQRDSASLTARVNAIMALHAFRSLHESRTIAQLERYMGPCVYENAVLGLVSACMPGAGEDPEPPRYQAPRDDLLRCSDCV